MGHLGDVRRLDPGMEAIRMRSRGSVVGVALCLMLSVGCVLKDSGDGQQKQDTAPM